MQDDELFKLVEEAIMDGSVDEEMILLYARLRNLSMAEISELETLLKSCRCSADKVTDECPEAGSLCLNFDTVVHKCIGRKKKCAMLVSAGVFDRIFDRWHRMIKGQFGGWEDKDVLVDGEVRQHKHDGGRYNLELRKVTLRIGDEARPVPKIWATVDAGEYLDADRAHLARGDEVTLVGRIEWDDHLHFYHLTDVTDLKVRRA
jgi:hypothetical protein